MEHCLKHFHPNITSSYIVGRNVPTEHLFISGGKLPTARNVSLSVHATISDVSNQHSHLMMAFGQFVDYDISLSLESGDEG